VADPGRSRFSAVPPSVNPAYLYQGVLDGSLAPDDAVRQFRGYFRQFRRADRAAWMADEIQFLRKLRALAFKRLPVSDGQTRVRLGCLIRWCEEEILVRRLKRNGASAAGLNGSGDSKPAWVVRDQLVEQLLEGMVTRAVVLRQLREGEFTTPGEEVQFLVDLRSRASTRWAGSEGKAQGFLRSLVDWCDEELAARR